MELGKPHGKGGGRIIGLRVIKDMRRKKPRESIKQGSQGLKETKTEFHNLHV